MGKESVAARAYRVPVAKVIVFIRFLLPMSMMAVSQGTEDLDEPFPNFDLVEQHYLALPSLSNEVV